MTHEQVFVPALKSFYIPFSPDSHWITTLSKKKPTFSVSLLHCVCLLWGLEFELGTVFQEGVLSVIGVGGNVAGNGLKVPREKDLIRYRS